MALAAAGFALVRHALAEARSDPIVRRATVALPNWPAGQPPITVALLSDLHVGTASTSVARLARVVAITNALHPDLVMLAGDYLPGARAIPRSRSLRLLTPLAALRAPLGVVAVLGNHDYWTGERAIRSDLATLGVRLLANEVRNVGPLAIGGVSDSITHHNLDWQVYAKLRRLSGARVVMTHSPELAPWLPPDMPLLLAGHTHCGQIRFEGIDTIDPRARFGRYRCGMVQSGHSLTVITAGIGTSGVPLRLGAPPDLWLLTLGPAGP